jgi:hypothetical protein
MSLCMDRRGVQIDARNIDSDRILMTWKLPLTEIVVDFYDKLKSMTSGYASFDYEESGYEESNLVKVNYTLSFQLSCDSNKGLGLNIHVTACLHVRPAYMHTRFSMHFRSRSRIQMQNDSAVYRTNFHALSNGGLVFPVSSILCTGKWIRAKTIHRSCASIFSI